MDLKIAWPIIYLKFSTQSSLSSLNASKQKTANTAFSVNRFNYGSLIWMQNINAFDPMYTVLETIVLKQATQPLVMYLSCNQWFKMPHWTARYVHYTYSNQAHCSSTQVSAGSYCFIIFSWFNLSNMKYHADQNIPIDAGSCNIQYSSLLYL